MLFRSDMGLSVGVTYSTERGGYRVYGEAQVNDLIDEFRLWTFPVRVGSGKRLFDETGGTRDLTLVKSDRTPNGVVMSIYRRGASLA